ncbi:MAG: 16S rRNA (guanine(527)-N(7))-methyltransferase RsmG [Anaerolineae bacterium]|nr:16S rRNA (guanine(527)-N(7))-methyltransferase RsmG [Anaerolineae bacterium]NIN99614.1 16S rRNA (guanine(527)-N(7))-methyltransferase RsmG [Anaerolineae bacterium]NIQ82474.1 16S rRNA (guanine(527)-N(7))-methyltransferase RsmG [Anaerolineae bacterium]
MGITLTDDQLGSYQVYYETLIDWNQRVNLTRITDYEEVQTKHFLDSLSCLGAIERARKVPAKGADASLQVIDVGTGAGFPGVVLKIASPTLRLTLLEATGKKAEFLRALVERLGLADVEVINARAEQLGHDRDHRERYDVALARALANMATLAELTLPLVQVGGVVIAQKGEDPEAEVETARTAIDTLGGQVKEITPVVIPELDGARHLVVLKKVSATSAKYPRRSGIPSKRPLV